MNWLDKILPPKIKTATSFGKKGVPEGVWSNCTSCQSVLFKVELERNLNICPKCNHHMRLSAKKRLQYFFDQGSLEWMGEDILPVDALKFKDQKRYRDRLQEAKKSSDSSEALVIAAGRINGFSATAAAFEFRFMGGSMGAVVGERFVRAATYSYENNHPFICFSASGGARMQEALFSLLQMSKTTAAISRLREKSIPYISVLTDPTMGGVSASLAMLGDIIIAEPNALVGFAGPRVIEQTVRETLPEGFQRAEFLLEHGAIDMIVNRLELKSEVSHLLAALGFGTKPISQQSTSQDDNPQQEDEAVEGELLPASKSS